MGVYIQVQECELSRQISHFLLSIRTFLRYNFFLLFSFILSFFLSFFLSFLYMHLLIYLPPLRLEELVRVALGLLSKAS